MPASANIPPIALPFVSDHAKRTLDLVEKFVEEECIPAHAVFETQLGHGNARWKSKPAILEGLKAKARRIGLWNMFMAGDHGAGFSNLEYGLMAEYLGQPTIRPLTGKHGTSSQVWHYGTEAAMAGPVDEGKVRSAFLMTEPDIASSDARNIRCDIRQDGDEYVINGSKWWSSGAGDPTCELYIVMGKTTTASDTGPYSQHSVILVPVDTPGITVHRMLSVYGHDDAPHGHGYITLQNVRVPMSNIVLGKGRGFEIIQGHLGPGRIHHSMRTIGAAERALEWMIARVNDETRMTFGKPLSAHGTIGEWIAKSRIEIDTAILAVLNVAIKINRDGAMGEIAAAKVLVPQTALQVIDRANQAYGAAGVCQDTPLPGLWASARTIRIVDGPDEVHLQQLGRREIQRLGKSAPEKIAAQNAEAGRLLACDGFSRGMLKASL
ncbi:hypothetical protein ASPWEDRAFT_33159 [Aspergillus wentii DTO 134E9]|uniref:Acyl-CoA dehydrogenase/oxidase C-terminal domain-containing protein n=1 Tax=Aspergillus wentii DTO 134E9 TaxID=1073089 RepID=A0A1L9R4U6_ASPWE|nr:uncharacterized protein ASPWEDRAFT_33159 [Aspergillus wentii DTO 134E9]OJJ29940.1 hypothetical protein ASPWEDRAFT_33159 [Aspergillus wentii DTO 134E9]